MNKNTKFNTVLSIIIKSCKHFVHLKIGSLKAVDAAELCYNVSALFVYLDLHNTTLITTPSVEAVLTLAAQWADPKPELITSRPLY